MSANHAREAGRECVKRAKRNWGNGWEYLSDVQKRGAIAIEIVYGLLCTSCLKKEATGEVKYFAEVAREAYKELD